MLEELPKAKRAIGRLELEALAGWTAMGTAFVVGHNAVLTALHVVAVRSAPTPTLRGRLRFVREATSIEVTALTAFDHVDDWALLELGESAGATPLAMAADMPLEKTGWWTFGYPALNAVEGINSALELQDPHAAYERSTAIAVSSELFKATDVGGLSGAPLMRGRNVYGILRSDLEEERAEGRRSFGILYATAISRVLDRADLPTGQPNPYQGMRPFEEDRAGFFFGRAAEAEELASKLAKSRLAVLMGGSGSGKSSLLRAGLLPLVRAGRLAEDTSIEPIVFRPGLFSLQELALPLFEFLTFPQRPSSLEALRHALLGSEVALADLVDQELYYRHGERRQGGLLLVVDQMEELYTGEERSDAQSFLRILCGALERRDSRVWVAGAIRDGFMGDLLAPSPFTETLRAGLVPLGPIATSPRLRELIVKPAESAGLVFDPPDLPDRIADDAAEASGGLPLLQYALDRLWQERKGSRLTGAAYHAFGGVNRAIAFHAQVAFETLDTAERELAKRVFLRLVRIRLDGPNTRRLVSREVLENLSQQALPLARRFVAARLLVETASGIEIAHEALIREWKPLRDWVKSAPEGELRLQQIEAARILWTEAGERREDLLPPHRARPLAEWAFRNSLDMTAADRCFLIENLIEIELGGEDWVPRFPLADVEKALARQDRTSDEELLLLAGIYAAGPPPKPYRDRLANLVVREASTEVGVRAGRLALEREGAEWLTALADNEPAVRYVLTGLLNERTTQKRVHDALTKRWGGSVRIGSAIRLAWEHRNTILFIAAAVYIAVWLNERVWWLLNLVLEVAGSGHVSYVGAFGPFSLGVWAGAGVYLNKRSAILDRPLTRFELWRFVGAVALAEASLYWLPQALNSMFFASARLDFVGRLAASLVTYVISAIVLIPLLARRAVPASRLGFWLRLAIATLVVICDDAFLHDFGVTELAANFVRHFLAALAGVLAAGWAGDFEWRPLIRAPSNRGRRLLRRFALGAASVSLAGLAYSWLMPNFLSPSGQFNHASRLIESGQIGRGLRLLSLACQRDHVEACQSLAEKDNHQWSWVSQGEVHSQVKLGAENGCKLGNIPSCLVWLKAEDDRGDHPRRLTAACIYTRDPGLCDAAIQTLIDWRGALGGDQWSAMAEVLCAAHLGRACAELAAAWEAGWWSAPDPDRVAVYRDKACRGGVLELCPESEPRGAPVAEIVSCQGGRWDACESLPADELGRIARETTEGDSRRLHLFRLACEGGDGGACMTYGEMRERQRSLLGKIQQAVPSEIQIPQGFTHTRLFPWGIVIDGVWLENAQNVSLLGRGTRGYDLSLWSRGSESGREQPRLGVLSCGDLRNPSAFGALLALPAPLPQQLPTSSPFELGEPSASAWGLLTASPRGSRKQLAAACSKVGDEGAGAVQAVLPVPGAAYLVRVTDPGNYDVLAEIRTWPMPDASLIVAWRVLKTWPAPPLSEE